MTQLQKVTEREVFVSSVAWQGNTQHTLVFSCSDPRFGAATRNFVSRHLQLSRYDPVALPGGPIALLYRSKYFFASRDALRVLCSTHDLKRVIGISHSDCRYYKLIYPGLDAAKLRQREIADLIEFRKEVLKKFPQLRVELYFAQPHGEGVEFLQID